MNTRTIKAVLAVAVMAASLLGHAATASAAGNAKSNPLCTRVAKAQVAVPSKNAACGTYGTSGGSHGDLT